MAIREGGLGFDSRARQIAFRPTTVLTTDFGVHFNFKRDLESKKIAIAKVSYLDI